VTTWWIETARGRKVAGPYMTKDAALAVIHAVYPAQDRGALWAVEYDGVRHPDDADVLHSTGD